MTNDLYWAHMRHGDPRLVTIRCGAKMRSLLDPEAAAQCCFVDGHPGMHHCVEGTADLWFGSGKMMDEEFGMRTTLDDIGVKP